jgi:hypothetical protein
VRLSRNPGTFTSWDPLGHPRPVTGLFYIYISTENPRTSRVTVFDRSALGESALDELYIIECCESCSFYLIMGLRMSVSFMMYTKLSILIFRVCCLASCLCVVSNLNDTFVTILQ